MAGKSSRLKSDFFKKESILNFEKQKNKIWFLQKNIFTVRKKHPVVVCCPLFTSWVAFLQDIEPKISRKMYTVNSRDQIGTHLD